MVDEATHKNEVSLAYNYQDEKGCNFNSSITIKSNEGSYKEILADAKNALEERLQKSINSREQPKNGKENGSPGTG